MQHVAERGYARTTLRQIARQANLTGGTVFYYFASKAELVTATFTELAEPALPLLRAEATKEASFTDAYTAWLEAGVTITKTHPHLAAFFAALSVAGEDDPSLRALHDRAIEAQRQLVADIVAIGRNANQFHEDYDDTAIADVFFALMLGLTELATTVPLQRFDRAMKAAAHLVDGSLIQQRPSDRPVL